MKKTLWKDIFASFKNSRGRFLSILSLMLLGSFALVGLYITGPNMRKTGHTYFDELNLADLTIISDYGLDNTDRNLIDDISDIDQLEYGYFADVVLKDEIETSFRIFSQTNYLSQYEIVEGRLPENENEIAISNEYNNEYTLGEEIDFIEFENVQTEDTLLDQTSFEIVGFVNSSEILSTVNLGPSTSGTGSLEGYAVVIPEVFSSDLYMLARMSFTQTKGLDPYSDEYTELIQTHKESIEEQIKQQPGKRLAVIKADAEKETADGYDEIAEAKQEIADAEKDLKKAKEQIEDAKIEINDSQEKFKQQISEAQIKIKDGEQQINDASASISQSEKQLNKASKELVKGQETLDSKWKILDEAEGELKVAKKMLANGKIELDNAQATIQEGKKQLENGKKEIAAKEKELANAEKEVNNGKKELAQSKKQYEEKLKEYEAAIQVFEENEAKITATQAEIDEKQKELDAMKDNINNEKIEELQKQIDDKQEKLNQGKLDLENAEKELELTKIQLNQTQQVLKNKEKELDQAEKDVVSGQKQITQAKKEVSEKQVILKNSELEYQVVKETYQNGLSAYEKNLSEYYISLAEWEAGATTLSQKNNEYQVNKDRIQQAKTTLAGKEKELDEARKRLSEESASGQSKLDEARKELEEAKEEYQDKKEEFKEKATDAEIEIAENEEKLEDTQEKLDHLSLPTYSVNTRKELIGAEGYGIYNTTSVIIDHLAKVFPIFLYLVAALVTSTTMTRFVDEERINSGTLVALGYRKKDVLAKFIVYGFMASLIGSVLGITLGHTLLPTIVNNAYKDGFTLPRMELHFYPKVSIVALILGISSATIPAYLVATKALKDNPANLLSPKPPTAGSKILLERITPLWNRLSFTKKVTTRNIFRYKKRMAMTIFGVAGSVALLVAGFGVQHSISGINERQFEDLMTYNMIVAKNDYVTEEQDEELNHLFARDDIKEHASVYYEELYKTAGDQKNRQEITLLVPENKEQFNTYMNLLNRSTQEEIVFGEESVIISERLAELLEVTKGDSIQVQDGTYRDYEMIVSDITEMYMGHFIFMTPENYKNIFSNEFKSNAELVKLKDSSEANVKKLSAEFMTTDSVSGVVQNTTLSTQIETIVDSLDKIMMVLILVAILLAIVILYNLININVSERIRELSTIKVLGFYDKEVTLYIYREIIILSLFGIFVGFGIGTWLHSYILTAVPPDNVMFNPLLWNYSYVIPLFITMFVVMLLGFNVNKRLKNVNMLEALKSVE